MVKKALLSIKKKIKIIDIHDKYADQSKLSKIGELEYEEFLKSGDKNYIWKKPDDEWQAISLVTHLEQWKSKRCCLSSQRVLLNGNRQCCCLEHAK